MTVTRTAFAELVEGSSLEKANALLQKFGIEKFFGIKNVAAFEKTLAQALKLGLTAKDARILAEIKAQGTKLVTRDRKMIDTAKRLGIEYIQK